MRGLPYAHEASSLCPSLEVFIHFLYSVTISNGSAFYFFEIIVLIDLDGIPTQIRMGLGSITFYARGSMRGQYVFFMPKS